MPLEAHVTNLTSICSRFSAADQLAAPQTFGVSFTDQLTAPQTYSVSFTDLLFTHVGLAYMFLCIREILFPTVCLFILEDEIKQ
jgi:hypothetical protein